MSSSAESRGSFQSGPLSLEIALLNLPTLLSSNPLQLLIQLIGAIWNCSPQPFSFNYDPNDSRLLCRELSSVQSHLKSFTSPYFHQIDAKIQPYYKPLQPHYENAIKTSKPHYKRLKTQSKKYWKKNVEPVRKRLVKSYVDPQRKNIEKHYGTHVQPHLERESLQRE